MSMFIKTSIRAVAVFVAGLIVFLALSSFSARAIHPTPPAFVVGAMIYVLAYAAFAFWVHHRSIAGELPADSAFKRKPSFMIPVCLTIALMVFIAIDITGHGAAWALG